MLSCYNQYFNIICPENTFSSECYVFCVSENRCSSFQEWASPAKMGFHFHQKRLDYFQEIYPKWISNDCKQLWQNFDLAEFMLTLIFVGFEGISLKTF